MLRLGNQILDFRKIQKNKMKLRIEQIDIVPFVHHIMDNFESLAEEHHIDFVFESEMPSLKLWVAADKLERFSSISYQMVSRILHRGRCLRVSFIKMNIMWRLVCRIKV